MYLLVCSNHSLPPCFHPCYTHKSDQLTLFLDSVAFTLLFRTHTSAPLTSWLGAPRAGMYSLVSLYDDYGQQEPSQQKRY